MANTYEIIPPEPHCIPGYTGYVPQYRFRVGKTFGRQSHRIIMDPCIYHSEIPVVNEIHAVIDQAFPSKGQKEVLKSREFVVDQVYRFPIVPGYDGFLPNYEKQIGKRFNAAAINGLVQHEQKMRVVRCERRFLQHSDLLKSGTGVFKRKKGERFIYGGKYRGPLIPVKEYARAIKKDSCSDPLPKTPYSKSMTPHFLECGHEEKYIVNGYAGHIPQARKLNGLSSKPLTHDALCDFHHLIQEHVHSQYCPDWKTPRTDSCLARGTFDIYPIESGMLPTYAGHVPGLLYQIGLTYGNGSTDAKNWLQIHKKIDM